jgi:two-component system phosphate regulon response regulator PhoB
MCKKILVLDDDKDILEILSFVLEDSGFIVKALLNGETILDEIREFHPDLILMDIMLADMDGRVICQELKTSSETKSLPVILISASHNVSDTLKQSGAPNDFIAKPFDIGHLISKVKSQIDA